ncbi:MAG TPA: hypothetical protein VF395_11360 [Polyangiaceae bacterium]
MLPWLEHRGVTRALLERSLFSIIIAARRIGLSSDPQVTLSVSDLAELEAANRRRFDLPR